MKKIGQKNPDKKKKPLARKRKKPSPTMLLNSEMLDIWSQLVKWRADYKCEYCGSIVRLHSHHVIRRGKFQLRWDLENGVCLCQRHHMYDSDFSAHKDGARFTQWIKDKRGGKWWAYLQDRLLGEVDREEQFEKLRNYSDKIREMKLNNIIADVVVENGIPNPKEGDYTIEIQGEWVDARKMK